MLHDSIVKTCHKCGFSPNIVMESGQWDLLIEAINCSNGITLLPKPIIDKICKDKVVQIHLTDPELPWIPTLAYRKEKFISTPMQLFLDMIQKAVSK